jgi:hypothetical protein
MLVTLGVNLAHLPHLPHHPNRPHVRLQALNTSSNEKSREGNKARLQAVCPKHRIISSTAVLQLILNTAFS